MLGDNAEGATDNAAVDAESENGDTGRSRTGCTCTSSKDTSRTMASSLKCTERTLARSKSLSTTGTGGAGSSFPVYAERMLTSERADVVGADDVAGAHVVGAAPLWSPHGDGRKCFGERCWSSGPTLS